MRALPVVLILSLMSSASTAAVPTIYECTYRPREGGQPTSESFVEVSPSVLNGSVDDYTGRVLVYDIVENSRDGLIAIAHSSGASTREGISDMKLGVILINKKTGDFRMTGYLLRILYEDAYRGHCTVK